MNSWATVALWRRYFQYEEEIDERKEVETSQENNAYYHHDTVEDTTATTSTPDLVRSDWARRELADFRRTASSRDYIQSTPPPHIEEQVRISNLQPPSPMTTTSTGLDQPDLRVNGMFLPQ